MMPFSKWLAAWRKATGLSAAGRGIVLQIDWQDGLTPQQSADRWLGRVLPKPMPWGIGGLIAGMEGHTAVNADGSICFRP